MGRKTQWLWCVTICDISSQKTFMVDEFLTDVGTLSRSFPVSCYLFDLLKKIAKRLFAYLHYPACCFPGHILMDNVPPQFFSCNLIITRSSKPIGDCVRRQRRTEQPRESTLRRLSLTVRPLRLLRLLSLSMLSFSVFSFM